MVVGKIGALARLKMAQLRNNIGGEVRLLPTM
jgi:hypothetical protein